MKISKWMVIHASLDPVVGSEQAKARPVLVLSEDFVNDGMKVVTIAPFTSRKTGRIVYPNEVLVSAGIANLKTESILLCHQLRAVDKHRFSRIYGTLADERLKQEISEALKFHFGIE